MTHTMKYRTANAQRQRRLRRCTNVTDPEDLKSELGAMRLLALEALEQGNLALADRLLTGVGKLAATQVAVKKQKSEYLDKQTVQRLLSDAVEILAHVIEGKFPNWEAALDSAADAIMASVTSATNEKDKQ